MAPTMAMSRTTEISSKARQYFKSKFSPIHSMEKSPTVAAEASQEVFPNIVITSPKPAIPEATIPRSVFLPISFF